MHQVGRCIQGCQEYNGNVFCLFVLLQNDGCIETADVGHHHVKQDKVRMLLLCHLYTTVSVACSAHLELFIRKKNLQQQHVADNIIDYQYFILASIYL